MECRPVDMIVCQCQVSILLAAVCSNPPCQDVGSGQQDSDAEALSVRSVRPAMYVLQPDADSLMAKMLELNATGTRVERIAELPYNPADDWVIECDEDNGHYLASAALGQSSWAAWFDCKCAWVVHEAVLDCKSALQSGQIHS